MSIHCPQFPEIECFKIWNIWNNSRHGTRNRRERWAGCKLQQKSPQNQVLEVARKIRLTTMAIFFLFLKDRLGLVQFCTPSGEKMWLTVEQRLTACFNLEALKIFLWRCYMENWSLWTKALHFLSHPGRTSSKSSQIIAVQHATGWVPWSYKVICGTKWLMGQSAVQLGWKYGIFENSVLKICLAHPYR